MRDRESARSVSDETLKDRVRRAFLGDAKSYEHANQAAIDYLGELRSRMKDLSEGIRRTAVLLLLVAAVFQLLDQAVVVGLQVGPFRISDLSIIQRVLPAVFAYLIYDMAVLGVRYLYSINLAIEISELFQPSIRSNRLDVLLNPQGISPIWSIALA